MSRTFQPKEPLNASREHCAWEPWLYCNICKRALGEYWICKTKQRLCAVHARPFLEKPVEAPKWYKLKFGADSIDLEHYKEFDGMPTRIPAKL